MNLAAPVPGNHSIGLEPIGGPDQEAEQVPVFRQYLRIAMRRRFFIIGAVVACAVLSMLVTLLMTPRYTATTTIEISRDSDKVTDFQGVERETSVADQEFYQTQYGLLRARTLAERVANQLRMPDDPRLFAYFDYTSNDPAFVVTNGRFPAGMRANRLRTASEILLKNLSVNPTRLSRLVDVSFASPDAAFSAKVVNSWADSFIHLNLERKVQATSYGRNLLQQQLAQAKQRLDESQRQLVGYASAQQIINLPSQSSNGTTTAERSIVADDLAALNTALTQAIADRIQAEARYQQAGRAGASAEALRNPAINTLRQRRAELAADYQRLMAQFEPGYPAAKAVQSQITQLDRSIAREEERVEGSLQAEYREAQEREQALQSRVNQLKSSYLDLRRRSIQYNIYQQEVDTNRALYDGLLQRFKEIGVAGGVGINNISVVDSADIPQKPSSPRLFLNLLIGLVGGLAIGILLALALEQIDEAITDPAELERRLKLSLLGSVPKLPGGQEPKNALLDRKSDLIDAYIAVQTNLGFTTAHGVPRSFAVTSTRPAEGKSTTALALATTLARGQRKVILVDGDMRSPSVHYLGGVNHDVGLSNFLAGEDDISRLIFRMDDLGLTGMTAGPIPPNAAELLTSERLGILIERLLESFDHVVIDTPPVMGLADAPLIATRVEGVVFAVEAHGIRATLIKTAISRLRSANVRIFGGVLTKFEARRGYYGYGYEYGYGYGRDETAEAKSRQ